MSNEQSIEPSFSLRPKNKPEYYKQIIIKSKVEMESSEGKKCCVSRAYAVCWVTPNFWENALTAEKKN